MVAVWAVGAAGCVRVESHVTYAKTRVSTKRSVETVEDSRVLLAAQPTVRGLALAMRVETRQRCRFIETPVFRKRAYESREPARGSLGPLYSLAFGGLGVVGGSYSYVNADALAATDTSSDPMTAGEYRNAGIVFAGLGLVLLGVAAIDAMRLADEEWDAGLERGEPDVREAPCRRKALARAPVAISAGSWRAEGTTDSQGAVSFELRELPESAFASGQLAMELVHDGTGVTVELPTGNAAAIFETLVNDPASRIARDRQTKADIACRDALSKALASVVDASTSEPQIARATERWATARTVCGDRWTDEDERAHAAFEARLAATAAERLAHACSAAGTAAEDALVDDEPTDAASARAAIAEACSKAGNARQVAEAFERKLREHERRATARARLVRAAELVDAQVARNDAGGIESTLRKHPELVPLLRRSDEMRAELVRIATHWIDALERDLASATTHRQVCASRRLVIGHVGNGAWTTLRAAAVKRSSVTSGTRLARLLDGGACS